MHIFRLGFYIIKFGCWNDFHFWSQS